MIEGKSNASRRDLVSLVSRAQREAKLTDRGRGASERVLDLDFGGKQDK